MYVFVVFAYNDTNIAGDIADIFSTRERAEEYVAARGWEDNNTIDILAIKVDPND